MRKLLILTVALLASISGFAQRDVAVCHTPATEKFAICLEQRVQCAHPAPRAYVHVSTEGGEMIKFKTPDGTEANGYLLQPKTKSNNWIFVIQEWWGLNDNIKRQSEDLFKALGNVNVIALDMYDGKVATDKETAGQYMQQFKQERGNAIFKGAVDYAGAKARLER